MGAVRAAPVKTKLGAGHMSLIAGWNPKLAIFHRTLGRKYMGAFLLMGRPGHNGGLYSLPKRC
jgi:hypothetical protein